MAVSATAFGYIWEWNDLNDSVYSWKPYSKEFQPALEVAHVSRMTATITVDSVSYLVHVNRNPMVQLNTKTKYRRRVRRRLGTFSKQMQHSRRGSVCTPLFQLLQFCRHSRKSQLYRLYCSLEEHSPLRWFVYDRRWKRGVSSRLF